MAFDLQEFTKKYDVHPETVSYLTALAAQRPDPPQWKDVTVEQARADMLELSVMLAGGVDFSGTDKELVVPSPDVKGNDPVFQTVYRPESCDQVVAPSIVIHFHGGGNVVGCRETHATTCKRIARDASCLVVNVEYRMGPEHKFPANHDDGKTVVEWVSMNKALVGGSSSSAVGVAGDSAGGWISALVCHELPDLVNFAVLVYPHVDFTIRRPSTEEFINGPILTGELIAWFMKHGVSLDQLNTHRASPFTFPEFSRLQPTLVLVAEFDTIRDGCYDYAEKMKAAGIETEVFTLKGVPHSYWNIPGQFKDCCRLSYDKAVEFIKSPTKSG